MSDLAATKRSACGSVGSIGRFAVSRDTTEGLLQAKQKEG